MIPHDILTLYTAKLIEYFIALAFLALFVPFWHYATGERRAEQPALVAGARRVLKQVADIVEWFHVDPTVAYHPGHSWIRVDRPALVTVGMDDFAQKLVGPIAEFQMPHVGSTVSLGEPAWAMRVDGAAVTMRSPVDGVVAAVNPKVMTSPGVVKEDPYGEGWLLKVHAPRLDANRTSWLSGGVARRWIEETTHELRRMMAPELGLVLQDGGTPVDGLAHAIDPERWEDIARRFLLS